MNKMKVRMFGTGEERTVDEVTGNRMIAQAEAQFIGVESQSAASVSTRKVAVEDNPAPTETKEGGPRAGRE